MKIHKEFATMKHWLSDWPRFRMNYVFNNCFRFMHARLRLKKYQRITQFFCGFHSYNTTVKLLHCISQMILLSRRQILLAWDGNRSKLAWLYVINKRVWLLSHLALPEMIHSPLKMFRRYHKIVRVPFRSAIMRECRYSSK